MGRTKGIKNSIPAHQWTLEEISYLSDVTPGNHYRDIQVLMSKKFNYDFTYNQIRAAIKRYKFSTGLNGQFRKGNIPHNKGTKGLMKANRTTFKKGHKTSNYKPVGTERIIRDGYLEVKVADPNVWELKHRTVYREHHGEIPKDHIVIFADGDKTNFNIDNLLLVSRHQLLVLNKNKLIKDNVELTKTGINVANLIIKLSEIKNNK